MHEGSPGSQKKPSPEAGVSGDAAIEHADTLEIKSPESLEPKAENSIAKPERNERAFQSLRHEFDTIRDRESLAPDEKTREYRRITSAIDDELSRLKRVGSEHQQLQTTREKLGMPQESAVPENRDTANEAKKLETLRAEIQAGMLESKQAEGSAERERGLRQGSERVAMAGELFRAEVQRRDKNGMDPFFDSRAFAEISGGIQNLRVFAEYKGNLSADELAIALARLNSGLEKIGRTRHGGLIREDEASLGRLAMAARDLYESSARMGGSFRKGDENASRAAQKLQGTSEKIYGLAGRMRSAVRNYNR